MYILSTNKINIFMKDVYIDAFRGVVKETQNTIGYELPEYLEAYIVLLLANYMERPDFLPEHGFANAYLMLSNRSKYNAKDLGDACLIVTGAFKTYGSRKGLERSYFQNIGISSYEIVAGTMNYSLFDSLSKHFVFLSDFIDCVVSPQAQYKGIYH